MWGVSASVPLTRLSSPSSRAKQAEQTAQQSTVCAINYAKFLPPTPTAARPPHLAPSLASELLLNNCANFQFMFLLVMVATPARQQAGWQAIRIDSFIDFCHFLVLFAFSASAGAQPGRQSGSQVAHPPCCPVNRDRQLQTRRGNATSAAGNVWPHTRTHTHTHMHTYGNVYLICILPFDG